MQHPAGLLRCSDPDSWWGKNTGVLPPQVDRCSSSLWVKKTSWQPAKARDSTAPAVRWNIRKSLSLRLYPLLCFLLKELSRSKNIQVLRKHHPSTPSSDCSKMKTQYNQSMFQSIATMGSTDLTQGHVRVPNFSQLNSTMYKVLLIP